MRYARLGSSGLIVSRVALGCMSYGDPARGAHHWTLPEDHSVGFVEQALELGVTFFDTANVYSLGDSERILGRALGRLVPREDVVIATKVHQPMRTGPSSGGLSRREILHEVDASLRRLDTDYIDLYIVHRWDPHTPVTETMQTLDGLVQAGKVRYLGASSMRTWQFVSAQYVADLHGWTRFISMQNHYNLLSREEEREMLPYCAAEGVGVTPWSPLARGLLARGATDDPTAGTRRAASDTVLDRFYTATADADRAVLDAVGAVATERDVPRAQVALAWLLAQPTVVAPIVGATREHHLVDAVTAVDLELTDDELARLAAPYTARTPPEHA